MRNIIRIFTSDAKRLATNVVAVVVIMGLSVIPCLYAWFNIMSNWDPYGEKATSNLSVVVANCDEGIEIKGIELNVGDKIVSNLKENKTIKWSFVDTEAEAVERVYSGDSYAALVIDETFSQNMISFLGGEIENPKITYYENEKKNAIAPKITSKVKTTVQEQINSAFVSTLAQSLVELSDQIVSTGQEDNITGNVKERLNNLNGDLNTYITILDSYISMMDSAAALTDAAGKVGTQLDDMTRIGRDMTSGANESVKNSSRAIKTASDMLNQNLPELQNKLKDLKNKMVTALEKVDTGSITEQAETTKAAVKVAQNTFNSGSDGAKTAAQAAQRVSQQAADAEVNRADSVLRTAQEAYEADPTNETKREADAAELAYNTAVTTREALSDANNKKNSDYDAKVVTVNENFDKLYKDMDLIIEAGPAVDKDAEDIKKTLTADFDACIDSVGALADSYKDLNAEINTSVDGVKDSIDEIQRLLNFSSDSIRDVSAALGSYPDMMSFGKDQLVKSRDEAQQMSDKLNQLIKDMDSIETNDQYNMIVKLIQSDPQLIADFISSPVKLNQEPIYEVANNGSATAPFYIILSIWVGALILIAIMHTTIKNPGEFKNLRNYQMFFGRYIVFFLIGQLQTLITVLGAILYVGIQCKYPILFYIAASFTSFTFTLFMYSLGFAFGNVGEAVAVVLMVIQVAGSGGTFPIEVLPKEFQYLYNYMPFAHGMNALRECIGGMHGNDYWIYLAGMLTYIGIALFFGLIVAIPYRKLNVKIEESKERTDLLL